MKTASPNFRRKRSLDMGPKARLRFHLHGLQDRKQPGGVLRDLVRAGVFKLLAASEAPGAPDGGHMKRFGKTHVDSAVADDRKKRARLCAEAGEHSVCRGRVWLERLPFKEPHGGVERKARETVRKHLLHVCLVFV